MTLNVSGHEEKTLQFDPRWRALEEAGVATRQDLCAQAMVEIIGGAPSTLPRMGLCLSGGGWRAMTSATAMFDALSVPCPTVSGKNVKPLDCFTHAFGLSGGSWMLFNTMAGASKGVNPFHDTTDNPWLWGDHFFDPAKHNYAGLIHMMDKDVVDDACCRGNFRKSIGFLSTRIGADSTIAAVLASKHLGPTLVERWASFISGDLLGWMDSHFETTDDVKARIESEIGSVQSAAAEKLDAAFLSIGKRQKADKEAEKQRELEREWKLRATLPSQTAQLGHMKQSIVEGALPFIVCTAIANKEGITQDEIDAQQQLNEQMKDQADQLEETASLSISQTQDSIHEEEWDLGTTKMRSVLDCFKKPRLGGQHHKRLYDWVEFSPFFARSQTIESFYPTCDEVQGSFADADIPQPMYVHHLMAICGSAFACDLSCALPTGVQARLTKNHELNSNPIIGRGTTTVGSANQSGPNFGECRDAGIDFNVPLPPMLSESGREFDIIVVMDAGAGSVNAHELQRCIDLGYVEAPRNIHPHRRYAKGRFVRVYRHPRGPTIIYFIGLVDRGTHMIICPERLLRYDTSRLRERVIRQLVPTILAEMTRFKAKLERKSSNLSRDLLSGSTGAGDDEMQLDNLDEVLLDGEDGDEDDNLPSDEALSEEVKTIMLSAAATGKVKNEYDAFKAAEDVVVFGNRRVGTHERGMATFQLESHAVSRILGVMSTANLNNMPTAVFNELQQYQVIIESDAKKTKFQRFSGALTGVKPMVLSDPWIDYYAAVGLATQLMRDDPRLLSAINRENTPPSCTAALGSIPIHIQSKLWSHLALCIKTATSEVEGTEAIMKQFCDDLFANFERFASTRDNFTDEEKGQALTNFSNALVDCGLESQLIAMIERYDLSPGERIKVGEAAARTGTMPVLQYLARWPATLDQPSILAAAYACPDPEVAQWLRTERKVELTFIDACKNGWFEAVGEFCRSDEYRDSKDGGWAALTSKHEVVANVLYSRGSSRYRDWLAAEIKTRDLPWNNILLKAGLLEDGPSKARGAGGEAPKDMGDKALDVVQSVASRAENAKKSVGAKLGGLFGMKRK